MTIVVPPADSRHDAENAQDAACGLPVGPKLFIDPATIDAPGSPWAVEDESDRVTALSECRDLVPVDDRDEGDDLPWWIEAEHCEFLALCLYNVETGEILHRYGIYAPRARDLAFLADVIADFDEKQAERGQTDSPIRLGIFSWQRAVAEIAAREATEAEAELVDFDDDADTDDVFHRVAADLMEQRARECVEDLVETDRGCHALRHVLRWIDEQESRLTMLTLNETERRAALRLIDIAWRGWRSTVTGAILAAVDHEGSAA